MAFTCLGSQMKCVAFKDALEVKCKCLSVLCTIHYCRHTIMGELSTFVTQCKKLLKDFCMV